MPRRGVLNRQWVHTVACGRLASSNLVDTVRDLYILRRGLV